MDARALLETVAETYAKLSSFEVETLFTSESGDQDSSQRGTQRGMAMYAAPDRVRVEQCGRLGFVTVKNGVDHHHYSGHTNHYWLSQVQRGDWLLGSFRPEHPLMATTFLFQRIAENVMDAVILRDEPGAEIEILVTYESVQGENLMISTPPVAFWIDRGTNLVSRMEGEVTVRFPEQPGQTSKQSYAYSHAFLNQEIPPQAFEYTPPPGAIDDTDSHHRHGSGSGYGGSDEKKHYQTWHSAEWEDDTFVDNFEIKIRGLELNFERRLTFEGEAVRILEKITGPGGTTEQVSSIKAS